MYRQVPVSVSLFVLHFKFHEFKDFIEANVITLAVAKLAYNSFEDSKDGLYTK